MSSALFAWNSGSISCSASALVSPSLARPSKTLRVLVEARGNLVSKQDLMTAVWPETSVEDNNLDRNISTLRKALGEQSSGRPFIETVPRVGYRFLAPVTEYASNPMPPAATREPDPPTRQEIRFCSTADNVRLAYATVGCGNPIVKVANCFNHLDFEWEGPIWRHWVRDLANSQASFAMTAAPMASPNGMSKTFPSKPGSTISRLWSTPPAWINSPSSAIRRAAAIAIAYAVRHPERVSHLVFMRCLFARRIPQRSPRRG